MAFDSSSSHKTSCKAKIASDSEPDGLTVIYPSKRRQHITSYERIRKEIMDLEQYACPAKSSGRLSEALLDLEIQLCLWHSLF
ncbi:MAG: hypothetical protein WBE61_09910 [Nitrososphaeraceae archaeon]